MDNPKPRHINVTLTFLSVILVLSSRIPLTAQEKEFDNCTSVIVGRAASVDGSTMTSHSCDSRTDRTWIDVVPRREHEPGSMCPIYMESKRTRGPDDEDRIEMGEIPQVPVTYAFINTAYAVINEHQLAIGETTFGGKRELRSDEGMIDCPELYRLVLERCKTAREAIRLIDALTREYGYNDWGECLTFADPEETWHFEILGPGKDKVGAVWAAVRIPDEHVGVSANASRIRQIDLSDPENYMASDNVFSLAEAMGWWDSKSGEPFEFCYAYASRKSMACRRREWRVLSLAAPSMDLDPNGENFPFSVKPDTLLSVRDLLKIFRDTYAETPYDMTRDLINLEREGKAVKNPMATPFMNRDMMRLLRVERERTIACERATYVQITQSRSWLPDPIGGVVWLGYDNPTTTPHIPFYCGITSMPASYRVDGREKFRRDCAWWAFRRVSQLAKLRWQEMVADIREIWSAIEDSAFAGQQEIEREAARLYAKNPRKARAFLTDYSHSIADKAVEAYWQLGDDLWSKYTNKF